MKNLTLFDPQITQITQIFQGKALPDESAKSAQSVDS
jgi:hypothetical protein